MNAPAMIRWIPRGLAIAVIGTIISAAGSLWAALSSTAAGAIVSLVGVTITATGAFIVVGVQRAAKRMFEGPPPEMSDEAVDAIVADLRKGSPLD